MNSSRSNKIAEAIARGELDDLPGAGRPLELDDDALVPEDLRLAYRILKNAGYVPPEVEALNEIAQLEALVSARRTSAAAALEGGAQARAPQDEDRDALLRERRWRSSRR